MAQIDRELLNSMTNVCNAALKAGGLACLDDANRVISWMNIVIKENNESQKTTQEVEPSSPEEGSEGQA